MGRVRPSQVREGVNLSTGIPFFKFEPGTKYHIIFPIPKGEEDVFIYQEATHSLNINGRFRKYRCVNADYQVSEESKLEVIKVDENGEAIKDPSSGRVINDGTCPLCELNYVYRQWIFQEVEEWKEKHPDASDKEISKKYKEYFGSEPVSSVTQNDEDNQYKVVTTNIVLGLVYKLDDKERYVTDKDGNPVYDIRVFDLSESRFKKLMTSVSDSYKYMSDKIKGLTNEDGLAWNEVVFNFPENDDKAQSGKDLLISVVPSGHSAIEKYDGLHEKIVEELSDIKELEKTFENFPSLKVRSIVELEKELQGKLQQYKSKLKVEEKEELAEKLSDEEKTISNEDAEEELEKAINNKPAEDFQDKEDSGEEAFLS